MLMHVKDTPLRQFCLSEWDRIHTRWLDIRQIAGSHDCFLKRQAPEEWHKVIIHTALFGTAATIAAWHTNYMKDRYRES